METTRFTQKRELRLKGTAETWKPSVHLFFCFETVLFFCFLTCFSFFLCFPWDSVIVLQLYTVVAARVNVMSSGGSDFSLSKVGRRARLNSWVCLHQLIHNFAKVTVPRRNLVNAEAYSDKPVDDFDVDMFYTDVEVRPTVVVKAVRLARDAVE